MGVDRGHQDLVLTIVISKLLKRHSKGKCRAPAHSRELRQIRGFIQKAIQSKLRSNFQLVRGDRVAFKVGVV